MSFSGDLQGIGLTDVFQNIAGNRTTGTLHVRWRGGERYVRFEDGMLAGLSFGPGKGLPLLHHIRQRQYVERKRLDQLMHKNRRSRKPVGRMLVEQKVLTPEELAGIIAEMVEEGVYDLMPIKQATFTFTEGPPPGNVFDPDQRDAELRLETGPILIEGARRADEWERIRKVIGTDRDLFVALEGWEEVELDEVTTRVAELLDGTRDMKALLQEVPASRFTVSRAVCELVQQGLARRCTGDEIQERAREAVASGHQEAAITLLTQALTLESSNLELRRQLASLYEELDRPQDAAAEYAVMGYQAAKEERLDEALEHYAHAAALKPTDPTLHERRVELLERLGDVPGQVEALLQWADLLEEMGLMERARGLLGQFVAQPALRNHPRLLERLARTESALGRQQAAADHYVRLADNVLEEDVEQGLDFLRKALQETPEDENLKKRIHDIESGEAHRRQRRRRRRIAVGVTVLVLAAVGTAGTMEMMAARGLATALRRTIVSDPEGVALALGQLERVGDRYSFTPSGQAAAESLGELFAAQLRHAEELLARGEHDRAEAWLQRLEQSTGRGDFRSRCAAMRQRVAAERRAFALLQRLERHGSADPEAANRFVDGASGDLLEFYLAQLPRLRTPLARRQVLRALGKLDHPRSLAVVAREFLRTQDPEAADLCKNLLARARDLRESGHEAEWRDVYPELEQALENPELKSRAATALQLLRGDR